MELVNDMTEELERWGRAVFPRVRAIEQEVWEFCASRNRYGSMGRRVSTARYGAPLHARQQAQGFWSVELWELTHVCLEDGLMTCKAAKIALKSADISKDADAPTGKGGIQIEDKALRGCQNAVILSQLLLQSRHHLFVR